MTPVGGAVAAPGAVEMLVPDDDVAAPVLSIVIPALNEELTITQFVEWCKEGLQRAGVAGEIVIVDSSTDATPERARAAGARVLRVPKRGLGRAYIDALPHVRGRWILMGDADCTYDFRELAPFVEGFEQGYEYVMGSRWKGSIERHAMPPLHQYFGTPFTTWILNRLYGSRFSDIHCGMRGITRDALERMHLHSQSWEYASEMVLKSVQMGLRTTEVPVTFLKDQDGRVSHHRREGWLSPFKAAWINLRAMFVYGADFFLLKPGILVTLIGLLLVIPASTGDVTIGGVTLSLNWQFLGVAITAIGFQMALLGCIAQVLFDFTGARTRRWRRTFRYTRTVGAAMGLVALGVALLIPLVVWWLTHDMELSDPETVQNHLAVTGLAAVVTGAQLFVSTLVIHGAFIITTQPRPKGTVRP